MGTIVRTAYVSGADITAEGQNANEDLVVNEFNGNIENVNIKASAAIAGTKIAVAPAGIPTDRINDLAVTTAKLADDAVDNTKLKDDAAVDVNRAVTTNHIRDLAVTIAKIADAAVIAVKIAVDAVIAAKVKTATHDWTPGGTLIAGNAASRNTTLGATVKPLLLYLEGSNALVVDSIDPGGAFIVSNVWWNTGTATWWITISCPAANANIPLAGITFKLLYVQAA